MNADTPPSAELDTLCDAATTPLAIGGETIELQPLTVRQFAEAGRCLAAVFQGLEWGNLSGDDLLGALIERADEARAFLACVTGRSDAWIDALDLDGFFRLFNAAQKANPDFFYLALRRVARRNPSPGPMPSNSWSSTATSQGPSPATASASSSATSAPADEWSDDETGND